MECPQEIQQLIVVEQAQHEKTWSHRVFEKMTRDSEVSASVMEDVGDVLSTGLVGGFKGSTNVD